MNQLSPLETEYIQEKKRLEYEWARPYMEPVAHPDLETEPEFRERVREAIVNRMPEEERRQLRAELDYIYTEIQNRYKFR